jgi:Ulp1 family protease
MAKKAELKEITLKSKLAKTVPKQELAKQYDNYVAQKAVQAVKPTKTPAPRPERLPSPAHASEPEPEEEEEETIIVKKPKKKIKKKIIFESESDDEEAVVVHKKKPTQAPKPPLENLVYQSNKDQLYQRMVEERIKHAMVGYGNSLGV